MIFTCVDLFQNSTHAGLIAADENEEVLDEKLERGKLIDQFNVSESLLVCADLVRAFDDENATALKNPLGLPSCCKIQSKNSLVILFTGAIVGSIVAVVPLVILVIHMCCPSWSMHIRWIQNHAIHASVFVRKGAAVNPLSKVCGKQLILGKIYAFPKHTFAVSNVCNTALRRNVKTKYLWKEFRIISNVRCKDQLVS